MVCLRQLGQVDLTRILAAGSSSSHALSEERPAAKTATPAAVDEGFTVSIHLRRPLDVASKEAAQARINEILSEFKTEIYKVMSQEGDVHVIHVRFRSKDSEEQIVTLLQDELGPVSVWTCAAHQARVSRDEGYKMECMAQAKGLVAAAEAVPFLKECMANMKGGKKKHLRLASKRAIEIVHASQRVAAAAHKKQKIEQDESSDESAEGVGAA